MQKTWSGYWFCEGLLKMPCGSLNAVLQLDLTNKTFPCPPPPISQFFFLFFFYFLQNQIYRIAFQNERRLHLDRWLDINIMGPKNPTFKDKK